MGLFFNASKFSGPLLTPTKPKSFANVNFSSEIIYAEEEETTSGDEAPDCE